MTTTLSPTPSSSRLQANFFAPRRSPRRLAHEISIEISQSYPQPGPIGITAYNTAIFSHGGAV